MKYINKSINYIELHNQGCDLLRQINYNGKVYKTANFWDDIIKFDKNDSLKYLEIGAFHGANAISFSLLYKNAEVHCIDPWSDYKDYPEYKNEQNKNYNLFVENLLNSKKCNQFYIHRDYSYNKLSQLQKNFFDIVYIDGNHDPDYVLEDAVLSFRLLKNNGYMIFDDYDWENVHVGVDNFINAYSNKIKFIDCINNQVFIQKV